MKAFISIKHHDDQRNRAWIEEIARALEQSGIVSVCVARDLEKWGQVQFDPETLMRRTFAEIDSSDLVVVDLSEKGVGVGIEAGYAHAKHIPIVTIAQKGADISTTLLGISRDVFWYEKPADLSQSFSRLNTIGKM